MVDQADFYSLTPDGQLCMPGRPYIPQLTVLHLLYHTPSLHLLRTIDEPLNHCPTMNRLQREGNGHYSFLSHYLQIPSSLTKIADWRGELLRDVPRSIQNQWTDWQKVEAIVNALREQCVVDPNFELADDVAETISHVLTEKRGTDYHLASTAVMLLRDWRIPCRLVTGFYCDTNRWDRSAGMAEVLSEDLHTWAEVYVHGAWIPIEPSGNYKRPREHRTWYQWCLEIAWASRDSLISHPVRYASGFLVVLAMVLFRRRIANALASGIAAVCLFLPMQTQVKVVLRLLQFRDWLCGVRFSRGMTVSRWLEEHFKYLPSLRSEDRAGLIATVQQLAYAPKTNSRSFPNRSTTDQDVLDDRNARVFRSCTIRLFVPST